MGKRTLIWKCPGGKAFTAAQLHAIDTGLIALGVDPLEIRYPEGRTMVTVECDESQFTTTQVGMMSDVSDRDRWFVVTLELPWPNDNVEPERVRVPAGECADKVCEAVWWEMFNGASGCGSAWDEVDEEDSDE